MSGQVEATERHSAEVAEATLLARVLERNPGLIEAAQKLHKDRIIPANSWVIDLDAIAYNSDALASEARKHNLTTYVMTKQYSRNPFVTAVALKRGMNKTVAVDIHGARVIGRFGIPLGNIGHLNQIPSGETAAALKMRPEVVTVYSVEAARRLSGVAEGLGVTQELLVRPWAEGDIFFPGQEGGFREDEVLDAVAEIARLPNVKVVGVTSFPCVRYNFGELGRAEPMLNQNLTTITRVAKQLTDELGIDIKQINAPGNTATETMALLASGGATHVEPGHGLLGTTPNHIFDGTEVEKPSYVYVTEVSHHYEGRAYAYGGGLWSLMAGFLKPPGEEVPPMQVLAGGDLDALRSTVLEYEELDQIIDYHASLRPGSKCNVGDTVVMAFYTQMQMTRSYVAPVSGIASGEPVAHGVFDIGTNMLDDDYNAVAPKKVIELMKEVTDRY